MTGHERQPVDLSEPSAPLKVYAAHPVSCYGSEHEARQLAALHRHFPGAGLLDPAAMFSSDEQWLEGWPDVLDGLDLLAVFADEAGYIGAGCLLEVTDAIASGVPVVALDQDGQLRLFGDSRATVSDGCSTARPSRPRS